MNDIKPTRESTPELPISRAKPERCLPVLDLTDYPVRRYICHRLPFQFSDDIISPAGRHLAYKRYLYLMNWNTNGG
jgi:hypothetical protein